MNERVSRRSRYIWRTSIFLALLIAFPAAVQPPAGRGAGLADLPYRLVPGMTSSVGVDLRSIVASDSLIVWEDRRGGAPDIYAYDVNDDREFRVSRAVDFRRQPAVSESLVVWVSGEDPGASTIRGIDLAEGVEFGVTSEPAHVERPVVSRALYAWQERVDGRWVIRAQRRVTGDKTVLGESARNAGRPSVSDSRLVWQEHDGDSWNILLFDAESGETSQLTNSDHDDQYPVISGNRVAFVRSSPDGGTPELVVLALDGGDERVIVDDHLVMKPSIHGALVVWEDWRSGLPDVYGYDLAHEETYAVARSQQATSPVVSDQIIAWISGDDPGSQRIQALEVQERLPTDPQDPPAVPSPERLYVPETQHFVSSGFKAFWQAHGGPQVLGFPLSEEFIEPDPESGDEIIVQYFERVKLEFHPDAPEDSQVRMARLGFLLRPESQAESTDSSELEDGRYFEQTGHTIRGGFRTHWEEHGGVGLFGYPVTGEFVENGRTVQYFERARFEFDPEATEGEQIKLGLLGREALQERGWLPPPPIDTTQIFE